MLQEQHTHTHTHTHRPKSHLWHNKSDSSRLGSFLGRQPLFFVWWLSVHGAHGPSSSTDASGFASIREKSPKDLTPGIECLCPEVAASLPLTGPNLMPRGREMQFSTRRRKKQKWLSAKSPNHSSFCKIEKDCSVGSLEHLADPASANWQKREEKTQKQKLIIR